MSSKALDPIKEYRSKQFRALPIVDLAATCCPSLDNLACITATSYERMGGAANCCAQEKASLTKLHKVGGAKAVMKCVLRTLSPVSICGRMGRDCRVDDLGSGESFYHMVPGPEDLPREVCRLANANHFAEKHMDQLDASLKSDLPRDYNTKPDAELLQTPPELDNSASSKL